MENGTRHATAHLADTPRPSPERCERSICSLSLSRSSLPLGNVKFRLPPLLDTSRARALCYNGISFPLFSLSNVSFSTSTSLSLTHTQTIPPRFYSFLRAGVSIRVWKSTCSSSPLGMDFFKTVTGLNRLMAVRRMLSRKLL